jgi:hypothetical protein
MFRGVKIFSGANKGPEYDIVTDMLQWVRENSHVRIVEKVVTQSTDTSSHHLSIILYYEE